MLNFIINLIICFIINLYAILNNILFELINMGIGDWGLGIVL